jgi:predicted transcriptional regulator
MSKRSKFELYGDILEAIRTDVARNGSARITRVQGRVNVPFDRFKLYLENLRKSNLVQIREVGDHEEIELSPKAYEYLSEYEHVRNFLVAFGLQDVPNRVEHPYQVSRES